MSDYPNWFAHYAERYFTQHLVTRFAGVRGLEFLQIGAFTGDASVWLLEHILTAQDCYLTDVDTWKGSDEPEHEPFDWADVEATYNERTAAYRGRLIKHRQSSAEFFGWYCSEPFDFVYIDGDHTAPGVLSDAVRAFDLLKPGGLIAFDDYLWKPSDGSGETHAPALAVDAFAACYADHLTRLPSGDDLQVWFKKATR